jgi:hypothetical protein
MSGSADPVMPFEPIPFIFHERPTMTKIEAQEKLLAINRLDEATVQKYLKAAQYIQEKGWDKFERDYDFAPYRYVDKETDKTRAAQREKSNTLKIDFRNHLSVAGVNAEAIDFTEVE